MPESLHMFYFPGHGADGKPGIMSISGRGADRKKAIDAARAALTNQGFTADGDPEVDLKPAQERHAKLTDKVQARDPSKPDPDKAPGAVPPTATAAPAATVKTP